VASFIFYGFWIPAYLVLLVASILFNHFIARADGRANSASGRNAAATRGAHRLAAARRLHQLIFSQ